MHVTSQFILGDWVSKGPFELLPLLLQDIARPDLLREHDLFFGRQSINSSDVPQVSREIILNALWLLSLFGFTATFGFPQWVNHKCFHWRRLLYARQPPLPCFEAS
ncbi:hypothetical protein Mapa_017553 [Marchantia paleacea]|nr:hypothetical protein Mapa_017553 [Marchantia paleacea]